MSEAEPVTTKPKPKPVEEKIGYMDLYRYSTKKEKMQVTFGLIFSLLNGLLQPTYGIIIGKIVEMFDPALPNEEKSAMMRSYVGIIFALTFGVLLTSYGGYALM